MTDPQSLSEWQESLNFARERWSAVEIIEKLGNLLKGAGAGKDEILNSLQSNVEVLSENKTGHAVTSLLSVEKDVGGHPFCIL